MKVELSALAVQDIIDLQNWIADAAGWGRAAGYTDRLLEKIAGLADFPARGAARPDFGKDVRSLTFERKLVIAYHILPGSVEVLRVVSGARDLGGWIDD